MPYSVSRDENVCPSSKPWAVKKDDDGSKMGCHATEEDAKKQVAAIEANEERKKKSYRRFAVGELGTFTVTSITYVPDNFDLDSNGNRGSDRSDCVGNDPSDTQHTRHYIGKHDQGSHGNWSEGGGAEYTEDDIEWTQSTGFSDMWDDESKSAALTGLNRVVKEYPKAPRVRRFETSDFYGAANKFTEAEPEYDATVIYVSEEFHAGKLARQNLVGNSFQGVLVGDSLDDAVVHEYAHILHQRAPNLSEISEFAGERYNHSTEVPSSYSMTSKEEYVSEAVLDVIENGDNAHPNSKVIAEMMRDAYGPEGTGEREKWTRGYNGESRHFVGQHDQSSHGNWAEGAAWIEETNFEGPGWTPSSRADAINGLARVSARYPNGPPVTAVITTEGIDSNGNPLDPEEFNEDLASIGLGQHGVGWAAVVTRRGEKRIMVNPDFHDDAEVAKRSLPVPEGFGNEGELAYGIGREEAMIHEYGHIMHMNMPPDDLARLKAYQFEQVEVEYIDGARTGQRVNHSKFAPTPYAQESIYEWTAESIADTVIDPENNHPTSDAVGEIMDSVYGEGATRVADVDTRHYIGKHDQGSHGNWSEGADLADLPIEAASPGIREGAFLGGERVWGNRETRTVVREGIARVKQDFPDAPMVDFLVQNDVITGNGEAWAAVDYGDNSNVINFSSSFINGTDQDIVDAKGDMPWSEFMMVANSRKDVVTHEYYHVMEKGLTKATEYDMTDYIIAPVIAGEFGARPRMGYSSQSPSAYARSDPSEWVAEHGLSYTKNGVNASDTSLDVAAIFHQEYGGEPPTEMHEIYTNGQPDLDNFQYEEGYAPNDAAYERLEF